MHKYFRHTVLLAGLLAAGQTTAPVAPPKPPADVSRLVTPILAAHKLPGMVIALLDGDHLTALGAAGVRKIGAPDPFLPSDLIHLGSDTKAMTAVLIGQLIDDKKLTLAATMADIFPDRRAAMNADMAKVTVQQLLCHTAGLPANLSWNLYAIAGDSLAAQRRAVVTAALADPPLSPPGSKFLYSNTGYVLLGAILEQKTGIPWEELIQKNLFTPLHMASAGFGPPGATGKIDQPWGHTLSGATLQPIQSDNPAVLGPAGRVHCTITDWAKFVSLFLKSPPTHAPIVSDATRARLLTPQKGMDYAGGWLITQRPWGGGTVYTHSGSNTMWYCTVWVSPGKNFATLVATNVGGDDAAKACDDASAALIKFHEQLSK